MRLKLNNTRKRLSIWLKDAYGFQVRAVRQNNVVLQQNLHGGRMRKVVLRSKGLQLLHRRQRHDQWCRENGWGEKQLYDKWHMHGLRVICVASLCVIWALHYTTSCHQGIASARRPRTDAKMRTTFSLVIRMIFMSFVVLVKGRVRNSILRESTGEARRRTMQRSRHTTKKSWAAAKITSPRSIALTVRKVPALISVVLHVSPKVSVCLLMTLSWFEAWSRHRSDQGCIHLIRRHTCPVANHSKKFLVGKWVLCSHCL